ncbi:MULTISPECIES: class I SAM-dependent methyltransferase [unclassified Rhodanobacter]|uniref:class I SAM-dependent methyltransferase n=1 Tax=unclassified Rhodanobacter TaxID=2621553 RepID=UPI001BDF82F3|nr:MULTISPECIES: class I SAM-dependent methyltransferase [unclassified Rhodanobacter]MBT2145384.1 class I SAM-dependent methyltransferase [Rhodanobacter sp. LX-99]MBT2149429.1 class I SAM-dependent methyltransferase [Rhodanobacter sp. LX-100]
MSRALQAFISDLEQDSSLREPDRLRERGDVLDRLEAYGLDGLPHGAHADATVEAGLRHRIDVLRAELEAIDGRLYQGIRLDIQRGAGGRRLLEWVRATASDRTGTPADGESYDHLDGLVSGVLQIDEPGLQLAGLSAEMVFYQPTPARHIFDMIARTALDERDVLVDLGSGLGQVPVLAAICTGARCIGIEWESAHVECAQRCARALNLDQVTFVQGDVRMADLSAGTVFYLYTPFEGAMLRDVLDMLRAEATTRAIRICTLGPCTATIARERWLQAVGPREMHRPAVFRSA